MLLREEYRWARDLDGADPNANLAGRWRVTGLQPHWAGTASHAFVTASRPFVTASRPFVTASAARQSMGTTPPLELSVQGLSSARNFFVCGHKMGQLPAQAIAITISVNGIQQQTFTLGDAQHFNVGIIDPIVLPGLANCFKVPCRTALGA